MSDFINSVKPNFEKVLEFLKKELGGLRVGRAAPSLVENIRVDSYGASTPLIHLASVTAPDPKTIMVQPWDKNLLKEIEKALSQANLGGSPTVRNDVVMINIAPLTEEVRQEIVKKLNQKLEEARVSLRGQREKIREQVMAQEKSREISEDDKFKRLEELDNLVKDYNEKIKELGKKKEEEIMTV
ncbi:MAG: ribosome recycling factor [Candidatus Komeilibacteria bacterium RIFCSPLOWO2_01_FULL_45_10]|uniref:Ribosome-recycling factor n=1 Tax=Candidatus Komeilibacteria bacterium RIFCSPLOWO2_01_FULL_45_10 TaxID=1798550 RepID=A0A1G2BI28_9BACT|nr:MAG: ribosome recycling factor [Candidatus Komeilibacteria bacterium RIFCSPLOWO2_01_FULL_45_10]